MHRRIILSCLLTVVSLLVATAPAGATTDVRAARSLPVGDLPKATSPPPTELAAGTARTTAADCAAVQANPAAYATAGARQVSCWSTSKATQDDPGILAWCDSLDANTWWITRTETCIHGITLVYTVIQVPTGTILGTATFAVSHEIELSATSLLLDDNAAVTLTASSGVLTSPVASFTGSCSAPCNTDDGDGFLLETFTRGETEDAFFSYSDDPVASADSFNTNYSFTVQPPPNTTPAPPVTWATPAQTFRCDDLVSNNPGCVIPAFTPELQVSISTHGAAAVGIFFAQQYLPDGWGSAVELTRLADESAAETNRRRICEDGTWVTDPTVRDDSCDEYAFARSRQSGAQFGLTGKDCAEVVPWFNDADGLWYIDPIQYNGSERCSRAHVPLDENSLVGSALGVLTNQNRILDHDKYWVGVYA